VTTGLSFQTTLLDFSVTRQSKKNMAKWTTPAYNDILMGSLEEYLKANTKTRIEIIKQIKRKIQDASEEAQENPPEDLSQVMLNHTVLFDCLIFFSIAENSKLAAQPP
jgi:hypothetical protein